MNKIRKEEEYEFIFYRYNIRKRKKYFEQNRVFSINQKDDQTYTAIVLGSEAYHTKITLDEHYNVMSARVIAPMLMKVIIVNMKQHSILRLKKDFLRMKKQYIDY